MTTRERNIRGRTSFCILVNNHKFDPLNKANCIPFYSIGFDTATARICHACVGAFLPAKTIEIDSSIWREQIQNRPSTIGHRTIDRTTNSIQKPSRIRFQVPILHIALLSLPKNTLTMPKQSSNKPDPKKQLMIKVTACKR